MKKLTKDYFLSKCFETHGHKYDYSLVEYRNVRTKVTIICKEHGKFNQLPKSHYTGQGCPRCYGDLNLTKDEFLKKYSRLNYDYILPDLVKVKSKIIVIDIKSKLKYIQLVDHHKKGIKPIKIESNSLVDKLKEIHNNKYDYLIEKETYYATDKIKVINNITKDEFYYRVDRHLKGMSPNKVTLNYFLFKSNELHGNKYDYSLIKEIDGNNSKIQIICKEHGVFEQRVSNHINLGDGCPKCAGVGKWNTELLISEFKKIHNNLFDYSKVEFEGVDKKVKIICRNHGLFEQNIHKHLNGQGCSLCDNNSKGEQYIKMYLEELNIKYIRQHGFDTCRYINKLNFDFYLPDHNTCIEFDGIQHFKPIKYFGGEKEYKATKERDKSKNDWCFENKVNLIRIKYNEMNKIYEILKNKLQVSIKNN
jgi:very-short-patch-repair endonuclease